MDIVVFVREIKGKNKTYLSLVENYRKEGKVKQRTILSFGATSEKNKQAENMATKLLQYFSSNKLLYTAADIREESRHNWGAYLVVKSIWDKFELDKLLDIIQRKTKVKFDINNAILLMLIDRICAPASKYKSFSKINYYHGVSPTIGLQHLYRSLDVLADNKDILEKHIFVKNKLLYNMSVEVVFFDVTTLYFESIKQDSLRDFGYGKDGKFNEVQVVLSLLVNEEGRPIGFDLFSGNTYEGHTLTNALKKLKDKYKISRAIVVADRGINTGLNLSEIVKAEFQYIVGCRLKNMGKDLKQEVLDIENYETIPIKEDNEQLKFKVINYTRKIRNKDRKIISSIDEQIVCTWSSKRARKDKKDRERLVEKAQFMLANDKLKAQRGAKKYITTETGKSQLNTNKISEDAKWDGYYGIETNNESLAPNAIARVYNFLWKIEESFRLLKSHLEVRPIFHWTPQRIEGHFVLSYIAFLIERTLELELDQICSHTKIREIINAMEFSKVHIGKNVLAMYAPLCKDGEKILKKLKIQEPVSKKIA